MRYSRVDMKVPVKIEEISESDEFEFIFFYTEDKHLDFMNYSGDDSDIHSNPVFSKKNGYDGVLGYAFVIPVFLSKIFGTKFPGGNELCLQQECNFRNPFYIGDKLIFTVTVLSINLGLSVIELDISVRTGKDKLIFTGKSLLRLSLV